MIEEEKKELRCQKCGKTFRVARILEKMFCIYCGDQMVVSLPPPPPPPEGVPPQPIKVEEHAEEMEPEEPAKEKAPAVCTRCGAGIENDGKWHKCDVCGVYFCDKCPGTHVPPSDKELEARVIYKYRQKTATVWSGDVARFYENMSSNVCSDCYEKEYVKVMWKIKYKIKHWKIDMLRDEDMKILEEIAPGEKKMSILEDKERAAKYAKELLSHLAKIKK